MVKTAARMRRAIPAACVALLVACAALAAVYAVGAPPAARATADPPPPASLPLAPGIAIATASFDLPDPFLLDVDGTYYMYLSSAFGNDTQNVPVLIGAPGHWSRSSIDAVPSLPAWAIGDPGAGDTTWSPAVYKVGNLYVMYLAPQIRGSEPVQHCIALGFSPDPAGPFFIDPDPYICQRNLGGDIDPQLFVDPHGPNGPGQPYYLIWKSDNNSTPGDGTTTIWAQPLANDGYTLEGQPVAIFTPDQSWQEQLVEAPQMALSPNGEVWLFFSAGKGFYTPDYGMGAVRCAGPLGPCNDPLPGPLVTSNAEGSGPGEETYFVGPGGSDWLLYSPIHTGDLSELIRPVEAVRIAWLHGSLPDVSEPGTFPAPTGSR
jgi:beta-xylosidase